MPCVHGSDSHTNDKIFKPDFNRYCWIKADPTFEGLKQVLYEPKERVRISSLYPEPKQAYQTKRLILRRLVVMNSLTRSQSIFQIS